MIQSKIRRNECGDAACCVSIKVDVDNQPAANPAESRFSGDPGHDHGRDHNDPSRARCAIDGHRRPTIHDAGSSNARAQRLDRVACHSPAGWMRHGCGWRRGVWPPPVQSAVGTLPSRPHAHVAPRQATQGHSALRQRPALFPVLCNPFVYSSMPPCRFATLLPRALENGPTLPSGDLARLFKNAHTRLQRRASQQLWWPRRIFGSTPARFRQSSLAGCWPNRLGDSHLAQQPSDADG